MHSLKSLFINIFSQHILKNMKKRVIQILLIAILLWNTDGAARNRSLIEMKQIAAKTMNMANVHNREDFDVVKETNNYAILSRAKGGIVIVAKNADRDAVLGYSESKYNTDILPCGFQWWLEAMDSSLAIEAKENCHTLKVSVPAGLPSSVQPLVPFAWGQRYPYNSMCPNGTYVGCVAVAMGQVMASHNYPSTGEGSHSYNWNGTLLSANFGETTYNWNAINSGSSSEIAKLLYHCGVSINTNYGSTVSTAFTSFVRDALVNYFRYKSNAIYANRYFYSDTQWALMLYGNLARGNAVVYAGDRDNSAGSTGHAFVIDGYDSNGYVHVNWGWAGLYDGYYDLATLQSDYAGYAYNHEMVCDIEPAEQQNPDNDKEYVDLGLPSGLLWAKTNVGANSPEESGLFYAWAETAPKSEYSWATYKYANGSETSLTKYCSSYSYGSVDYKETLESGDDAATVNWGSLWRTPTLSETQELISYCTWTPSSLNGVNGVYVTGPSGKSIFFPSTGVKIYNISMFNQDVCVQSATIFNASNGNPSMASVLYYENGSPHYWYGWHRCWGYPVRPVYVETDGINVVSIDECNEIIGIYDLQGHNLQDFTKGVNIVKYKNGVSKKIIR